MKHAAIAQPHLARARASSNYLKKKSAYLASQTKDKKTVPEKPPGKTPETTGDKPAGDKPAGDKPAGDRPAGDKPAGDKPAGDKPAGNKPAGDKPAGDKPAGDKPAGDKPAGDKPTGDKPDKKKPDNAPQDPDANTEEVLTEEGKRRIADELDEEEIQNQIVEMSTYYKTLLIGVIDGFTSNFNEDCRNGLTSSVVSAFDLFDNLEIYDPRLIAKFQLSMVNFTEASNHVFVFCDSAQLTKQFTVLSDYKNYENYIVFASRGLGTYINMWGELTECMSEG